jgi:metallo-beta-lactamase family protein
MLNGVDYVRTPDESKVLDRMPNARIIVSASGMATGGRVLHHLHALAGDPKNIILFTGYQAAGTRGADLVAGIDQIKIHGDYVKVNAQVRILGSYSAHADYRELLSWLAARESKKKPKRVFLTHGEPGSCDSLRRYISDRFQWECEIPALGETTELG